MKQLTMRYSDLVPQWDTGTPQGCSLSPLLFAGSIKPSLEFLSTYDGVQDIIAFADDIVVACDQGKSKDIVEAATVMFQDIGLTINNEKCNGTAINGKIDFLGQIFNPKPESLSNMLLGRVQELCKILNTFDLPSHQKYLMFKQCIVTAVNYGPLIDLDH